MGSHARDETKENVFLYFYLKIYRRSYSVNSAICAQLQAGRMSYIDFRLVKSPSDRGESEVEHRRAESEGLKIPQGTQNFFLHPTLMTRRKNTFVLML